MDKKRLRYDAVLIAVCLLVSFALWLLVTVSKKPGEYAVVTVNGKEWGRYSLSEDREVEIETKSGKNILIIKDGYADMIEADCPDGLCERQRKISKTGESIVCLPNKVTVTVEGKGEGSVDLVGAIMKRV